MPDRSRWYAPAGLLLGALAAALFLLARYDAEHSPERARPAIDRPAHAPAIPPAPPVNVLGVTTAPALESAVYRHDEREHPHPITERHVRIKQELNLIALMNEAVDRKQGARLRELAQEYRRSHPEDPNRLQGGYQVLADCLEHPGQESREKARRYYDEHRASTLRRYVRRVCLEPAS